jgi:hypothetical protein
MLNLVQADRPVEADPRDLNEDLRAAWVPDVAGGADFGGYFSGKPAGSGPPFQHLYVPKADGGQMSIRVLHPGWHAALHRAVAGLRDKVDAVLDPGVFGYRRGADGTTSYSLQWQAFSKYTATQSHNARWVVLTDVSKFFSSLSWIQVVEAAMDIDSVASRPLLGIAAQLECRGLDYLPSGYADARMLANTVLHHVDQRVNVPLSRWVDDYRLFVPPGEDPDEALTTLREALDEVGLELNDAKTRVLPAAEGELASSNALASVYHPDRDPPEKVQRNLRQLFYELLDGQVSNRRSLRFLLPRLAKENDDVALSFAFYGLKALPWDAPRLVGYISAFSERPDVSFLVSAYLAEAAKRGDAWLVARLGALACQTGIDDATAEALAANLDELSGTPAWGIGLRALALAGHDVAAEFALSNPPDPRSALVALRDLDRRAPQGLRDAEPVMASALSAGPAPRPSVDSIL